MFGFVNRISQLSKLIEVKAQDRRNESDKRDHPGFLNVFKFIKVNAEYQCDEYEARKKFWRKIPFLSSSKESEGEEETKPSYHQQHHQQHHQQPSYHQQASYHHQHHQQPSYHQQASYQSSPQQQQYQSQSSPSSPSSSYSHSHHHQDYHDKNSKVVCPHSVCMTTAAKFGLVQGSLTGAFFGGALGMYKYIVGALHPRKSGKEFDESEEDERFSKSTTNANIIFVYACNSAITCGILFSLFSSAKSAIYCY